jgi:2-oxoglutarate ferredoxin oxidoreductase subunit alpha
VNNQSISLAWRIGGPQGGGIDRLATVFGRLCAGRGLHLFSRREYHSNIIGRHSYADISIGSEALASHRETPDMLVTFDAESLARHINTVTEQGYALFADMDAQVSLDALPYLDARLKAELSDELTRNGLANTIDGLLEQARARGVQLVPLPYRTIIAELADELSLSNKQAARAINTIAVAASAALLGFADEDLNLALEDVFGADHPAIGLNQRAISKVYDLIAGQYQRSDQYGWLLEQTITGSRLYLNGCQSVALGKLAAGLTFQTYYPISPASDESLFLEANTPDPAENGESIAPLVLQVEDEIAAATMACGAALTGARSATATSGPGFCLMTEALGWAGMNEVPLVISLYQRGGPSTGLPTRTEQGDLGFVVHAGHGEFPRMVIASGDIEACFYDAIQAFNYAERFQLPVIHILDRALASCSQTVNRFDYQSVNIDRGVLFDTAGDHAGGIARFADTPSGISPRPLVGQDDAAHWLTGAEHDSYGQVSEDPVVREQMMEKRLRKLNQIEQELSFGEKLEVCGDDSAELILLTWGSSKGAVWDAVERLQNENIKLRGIQFRLLMPFPKKELLTLFNPEQTLIVAECNYTGQLNKLLRENTGYNSDHLILKYNGRAMSGEALANALRKIANGEQDRREHRIVLHNPYE